MQVGTAKKKITLQLLGRVRQPLNLYLTDDIILKTRPIVIKDLNTYFNISGPFLAYNKTDILYSKNALRINNQLIPMVNRHTTSSKTIQALEIEKEPGFEPDSSYPTYIAKDEKILPNCAVFVHLKTVPVLPEGIGGTIQASPLFTERYSCFPAHSSLSTTNSGGLLTTSIINLEEESITLHKGTYFGDFYPTQVHPPPSDIQEITKTIDLEWIIKAFDLRQSEWLQQEPGYLMKAAKLLQRYSDIISRDDEYGTTDLVTHQIHTEDHPPIKCKLRPLNPIQEQGLKEQIDHWERTNVIEKSYSPWAFPVMPVPKKNGKTRWVIDYRELNKITVKDSYPLPHIDDSLSRLSHSKVFSAIDSAGAFHCIKIDKADRPKTAFISPFGLYQFKRMGFGLCNGPAVYARLVQKVLENIPTTVAVPYLDDIGIHSPDLATHLTALDRVLQAHRQAGLKIQPEKCQLFKKKMKFLGHEVSQEGIQPISEYIDIVAQWPVPTNVHQLRVFLGKVAYYRRFIKDFGNLTSPLYELLCKEEGSTQAGPRERKDPIHLTTQQLDVFYLLRKALTSAPILAYPDFHSSEPFILDTDWSIEAIGGCLSQKIDGQERVICYGARKLCKREKAYSSNKGEILAAVHFMKIWRYYLRHRPFILRTDHQALRWIHNMEEPSGMIQRWLDILSNYNFQVQFRKGSKHGNADHLSRCDHAPEPTFEDECEAEDEAVAQIHHPIPLSEFEIQEKQRQDSCLNEVISWVQNNKCPSLKDLRGADTILKQYASIFETLYLSNEGILYRATQDTEPWNQDRMCLPESLQQSTIQVAHCQTGGHMGIQNTQHRINQRYYFPGMHKAVENFIRQCIPCQVTARKSSPQKDILEVVDDGEPWQRISLDTVGPISPPSRNGNKYLLTCKCCFTRWVEAFPIPAQTAEIIAQTLEREVFSRFGVPQQIHSDNGTYFNSQVLDEVCQILDIKKSNSPPYNPKSNSVERFHKDLNRLLNTATADTGQDWEEVLPTCLLALRTARNRMTGVTPFYAMYGREAYLPLDAIYPVPNHPGFKRTVYGSDLTQRMQTIFRTIRQTLGKTIERARMNYTGKLEGRILEPNDLVWLYTRANNKNKGKKFQTPWSGPWIVTNRISNVLYHIQPHGNWNKNKFLVLAAIDRLRRYHGSYQEGSPTAISTKASDYVMEDEFCEQAKEFEESRFSPSLQEECADDSTEMFSTYSAPVPYTVQEADFGEDIRQNATPFPTPKNTKNVPTNQEQDEPLLDPITEPMLDSTNGSPFDSNEMPTADIEITVEEENKPATIPSKKDDVKMTSLENTCVKEDHSTGARKKLTGSHRSQIMRPAHSRLTPYTLPVAARSSKSQEEQRTAAETISKLKLLHEDEAKPLSSNAHTELESQPLPHTSTPQRIDVPPFQFPDNIEFGSNENPLPVHTPSFNSSLPVTSVADEEELPSPARLPLANRTSFPYKRNRPNDSQDSIQNNPIIGPRRSERLRSLYKGPKNKAKRWIDGN